MITSNVERATKAYWEVSLAYNQRPKSLPFSVAAAMNVININLCGVGSHRRIVGYLGTLQENIIIGRKKGVA